MDVKQRRVAVCVQVASFCLTESAVSVAKTALVAKAKEMMLDATGRKKMFFAFIGVSASLKLPITKKIPEYLMKVKENPAVGAPGGWRRANL
jgi:hypothetical protein